MTGREVGVLLVGCDKVEGRQGMVKRLIKKSGLLDMVWWRVGS